jgi:pyruvate ferredoxin oxidoreductase alpha subunit
VPVKKMLDGNQASVEALRLARVQVVAAYPITPQSPIAEKLSQFIADGSLDARYLRVESEHSAMSCVIGAQLTGVRGCTATSSVGLALMHEVLGVASGCRVPIVMPVVNRALVSPWSLWCDHQDSMAERDSGWIQLYVENGQEVLDAIIMAYRLAEHPDVLLPTMVCLDGFFLSHAAEGVLVPDQETVDQFLPSYQRHNLYLDTDDPMFINNLTSSAEFTEMRYQQKDAFAKAKDVLPEVQAEFYKVFGRKYGMVEGYLCDDAQVVLVTLGSMSGTAKFVATKMRQEGHRVGVLKLTAFRPFPAEELRRVLRGIPVVGVLDRSAGLGAEGGPVCSEVKAALYNEENYPSVQGFIGGLGGRDLSTGVIEKAFKKLLAIQQGLAVSSDSEWIDLSENPLQIREVVQHV